MKYCSVCNEKFDDTVSFCPKDGEVLEEDPSSLIGSVLDGQYQIEGVLAKGGWARSIARGTFCSAIASRLKSCRRRCAAIPNGCAASSARARRRAAFATRMRLQFTICALPATARSIS